MNEVNSATDISEDHARTYRIVCMRIYNLAWDRRHPAVKEMTKSMSHPFTMREMAKRCGAEIRDATSS